MCVCVCVCVDTCVCVGGVSGCGCVVWYLHDFEEFLAHGGEVSVVWVCSKSSFDLFELLAILFQLLPQRLWALVHQTNVHVNANDNDQCKTRVLTAQDGSLLELEALLQIAMARHFQVCDLMILITLMIMMTLVDDDDAR